MQTDLGDPVQPGFGQRLEPQLSLGAGVGEQQRRPAFFQVVDHRLQLRQPQMPGPGKAVHLVRAEAAHRQCLGAVSGNALTAGLPALRAAEQHRHGLVQIAQGGGQPPHRQAGPARAQPRQAQLQLDAALAAQQLVPFVHDYRVQVLEALRGVLVRQQQRQALRRGDQRFGQPLALARPGGGTGVAGAGFHTPVQAHAVQRLAQIAGGVLGQRAQRGDPQHPQAAAPVAAVQRPGHRPQPGGQGLARTGGGMNQAGAAVAERRPAAALERRRGPALAGEPGVHRRQTVSCRRHPAIP